MDKPNHIESHIGMSKERLWTFKQNINFKNTNTRIILLLFLVSVMITIGTVGYRIYLLSIEAFDIYIEQEKIGSVREKDEILSIVKEIKSELTEAYDMEIVTANKITFEQTYVKDKMLTPIDDFRSVIKSKLGFMVYGYVLNVDGNDIGALKTKEDMEMLIEKIKEPFKISIEEGEILKNIKIIEDIKIERREMPFNRIRDVDDFHQYLLTNSEEVKVHRVEVGESFWTIGAIYNMSVEDLIAANPDKNPELVQIGDEIKLIIPRPVLTVETISEIEFDKQLKYESQVEYNDQMYNTHQKIKVAGQDGSSKVLESKVRRNGVIVKEEIIKEEISKNPVTEIIIKGTKEPPKTMATGEFLRPTRGRVSSPYGMRNGRMHRGLDIASATGTSIVAADGGKVVYVGYRGAYGKMVEIDHENGYKTRYAHNSQLLVEVGQRVYKGQEVSKMGSTGRSTGSHLHFEVIKSGNTQNPSNYVN